MLKSLNMGNVVIICSRFGDLIKFDTCKVTGLMNKKKDCGNSFFVVLRKIINNEVLSKKDAYKHEVYKDFFLVLEPLKGHLL